MDATALLTESAFRKEGCKTVAIFINGEEVKIPLDPPAKLFNEEMHAASVAVARYDEAHRRWVEANKDKENHHA